MWCYNETPDFIRSSESLNLSQEVKDSIKNWVVSFRRQSTKRTDLCFRSPHNIFEIWNARISNPDANRGTRGGFRLIFYINLIANSINPCQIWIRSDLGGRKEKRGAQEEYENYLKELKKNLLRDLDS